MAMASNFAFLEKQRKREKSNRFDQSSLGGH